VKFEREKKLYFFCRRNSLSILSICFNFPRTSDVVQQTEKG
jgi:hypothetical protein